LHCKITKTDQKSSKGNKKIKYLSHRESRIIKNMVYILQAKLIGGCQSSIELVHHLHALLEKSNELDSNDAKNNEVTVLAARYETLLIAARERKKQLQKFR